VRLRARHRVSLLLLLGSITAAAVVAGIATSAASAAGCTFPTLSQPFSSLGDTNPYFLAPGGNFESGASGWALTGGARLSQPNESFFVGSNADKQSLLLPSSAASATTPTICVTAAAPALRMFVKNEGGGKSDGPLNVYLNFADTGGVPQQVQIAALTTRNSAWTPSPIVSFVQYLPALEGGFADVSFTLTPSDNRGKWLIDDLYIDPYISR
jgi:hypothetical protein